MDMKTAVSEADRVRKSREEWASTSTVNFRDWICGTGQFSEENLRKLRDEFFTDMGKRLYERIRAAMDAAFADHDAVPAAKPETASPLSAAGTGNVEEPVAWAVMRADGEIVDAFVMPKGRTKVLPHGLIPIPLYRKDI